MRVMRDLIGATLSHRYRLLARVAGGGMGEAYRGHDMLLDRSVAVKVLHPGLGNDPDLVERFRAEARAAARLNHPNVVAVHDWGCEGEATYYMVMEYVSGTDLRDVLVSQGELDPRQALDIIANVCDALAVAHAGGLIHRDVKPENILVARDGTVKVADFGIAAVADADRTAPGGSIPGTLRYLSPEQARGHEAGASSDIWAVGAVLWELLTGVPPFEGSAADLLRRRTHEVPQRPSTFRPELPEAVDRLVQTASALDPADRYRSALEMGEAVRAAALEVDPGPPVATLIDHVTGEIRLPDMEPTTVVHGRKRRRRRLHPARLAVAAAIVLALLIIAVSAVASIMEPDLVKVPDVVGLTRGQAIERAEDAGLEIDVTDRKRAFGAEENSVLTQTPDGGRLEEGSRIEIVLSAGPPRFKVPDVTGLSADQARIRLAVRKLEVGQVTAEYSLKDKGMVIGQDPSDGRLEWGTQVALVVSKGPEPVNVPSVEGMSAAAAKAALKDAGLVPVLVESYSNDVKKGQVISSTPAAGTVSSEGTEVEVFVSIGPEFKLVTMPDVRNMDVASARAQLERLKLVVYVSRSCPGDTVVETDPIAGEKIRENTRVALFVC